MINEECLVTTPKHAVLHDHRDATVSTPISAES